MRTKFRLFPAQKPADTGILGLEPALARLLAGEPARGWRAKVEDEHPAWLLWRQNRKLMESRGFRVARDAADGWYLEVWATDEAAAALLRAQSAATESDLFVPVPAGLAYYGYQRAGVEFLASRKAALLADEMGVGKTIQLCGYLNLAAAEMANVLLVVPASMKACLGAGAGAMARREEYADFRPERPNANRRFTGAGYLDHQLRAAREVPSSIGEAVGFDCAR
jgi:hypothetical protein